MQSAEERALGDLLAAAHLAPDFALPALFDECAQAFGARGAVAYLVDLELRSLSPFLDPRGPGHDAHLSTLGVEGTLAGRAFQQSEVVTHSAAEGPPVVWLPLLDGTERLGVLAVTLPDADALRSGVLAEDGALRARLLTFASVAAELIVSKTQYGDSLVRLRRTSEMGLAAEMQWSLLPPLTFVSDEVSIAGGLEPAYEVGGDAFDYAVDPGVAHLAVFDSMGHGLRSAQISALAVAAYRNARRARRGLTPLVRSIDAAVAALFGSVDGFTTGLIIELNTETGQLRWVNAGHPEPLVLRNSRLVRTLHVEPYLPFGLGELVEDQPVHVGSEVLEPGDMVLLYSDGVVEARSSEGVPFGTEQLVSLVTRLLAGGLSTPETMRRLTLALLEHHQGQLGDDASLLLLQYRPGQDTRTASPEQPPLS